MSCDVCRACKNVGYCTFPRSGVVTECDEFGDVDEAPAFDWDLQEMLKCWVKKEAGRGLPESTE
ncbi:MAG: hypothetical protein ACYC64_15915 [Armatimonadota bacterium]